MITLEKYNLAKLNKHVVSFHFQLPFTKEEIEASKTEELDKYPDLYYHDVSTSYAQYYVIFVPVGIVLVDSEEIDLNMRDCLFTKRSGNYDEQGRVYHYLTEGYFTVSKNIGIGSTYGAMAVSINLEDTNKTPNYIANVLKEYVDNRPAKILKLFKDLSLPRNNLFLKRAEFHKNTLAFFMLQEGNHLCYD